MSNDIFPIFLLGTGFLVIFGFGEILYHFFKVKVEYTRKSTHVLTGLLTLLFPIYLETHWAVMLLCASFAVLLLTSLKYNFLKSINAVDRVTWGSILYPAIVYISFIIYINFHSLIFFYLPILIMAVSDPIAALFGKKYPYGKYQIFNDQKTIIGSLAFFISAIIISLFLLNNLTSIHLLPMILLSIIVSLSATIAEALSSKGFDNFTIPISVALVLVLYYECYMA